MRKPAVMADRNQNHFHWFGACGTPAIRLMSAPPTQVDAKRPRDAMKTRLPILRHSQVIDFKGE